MATTSTPTDPDAVVATVQAAFSAVRAQRDEARALLAEVVDLDARGVAVVPFGLLDRIQRAIGPN